MDITAIGLGLAFSFMWSSAFTSAHIIVAAAPPMMSLALRFVISGLIALALARAMGQGFRLTRAQWRATIVFGICQNALYLGLFFVAMQRIEASLASILASSMPLVVALIGWIVLRERLRKQAVLGLVAGLSGVVLIMGARLGEGADMGGLLLCVLGVIALSLATLSVRGASSGGNLMTIVGLQMLIGSLVLAIAAALLETPHADMSIRLIGAFSYTVFVPGIAATFVWFVLVNRIGAVRAAAFHFLNPVFGVLVAWIVLGESIRAMDAVGVVIIMAGILAVQLSRPVAR